MPGRSSTLIVGPPATGKKLLFEILNACPSIGPVEYQSAPLVSDLHVADRYVVASRERAAESLRLRGPRVWRGIDTCRDVVNAGIAQVEAHVAGRDVFRVDYRDLVDRADETLDALAEWVGVDRWPLGFEIYDADKGLR